MVTRRVLTPRGHRLQNGSPAPRDSPEHVMPSIETAESSTFDWRLLTDRFEFTPSVSLTPAPSTDHTTSPETYTSRVDNGVADSIVNRLANVDINGHVDEQSRTSRQRSQDGIASRLANVRLGSSAGNDPSTSRLQTPDRRDKHLLDPRPGRRSRRSSSIRRSHIVENEELPVDAFNQASFQNALRDARALSSGLAAALGSSTIHAEPDSCLRRLHTKALEYADFESPSMRTVGFVGESGAGKSSLLNSLLDKTDFLRTSNSGAACTCVIVEFRYHATEDFLLDVEYFDSREMKARLLDLLRYYRALHIEPQEGRTADAGVLETIQTQADLAEHTFKAMFGSPNLNELLTDDEDSALATLLRWQRTIALVRERGGTTYVNQDECSDALLRLSSEQRPSDEAAEAPLAVWPYVKKIRVFMKAHILSKGLILVDLPGLNDLNSARRNVTERYLVERKCDEIFAVCRIGRATTDQCVKEVFALAERASLPSIGIVCTRSDEIRENEAVRDWTGERATTIKTLIERRHDAKDEHAELQAALDADDDSTDGEGPQEQTYWDHRELRRLSKFVKDCEFELKSFMIRSRNDDMTAKLANPDNMISRGNRIQAFFVSNQLWWDHRQSTDRWSQQWLELSGIISLRQHCIGLVSSYQLRAAMSFIKNDLPGLLAEVELWVLAGAGTLSAERRLHICAVLERLERRLRTNVLGKRAQVSQITQRFNDASREHFPSRRSTRDWSRGASQAVSMWKGWAANTIAAFCRGFGEFTSSGAGVGYHCWNEEAMATMVRDLKDPIDLLGSLTEEQERQILSDIDAALEIDSLANDLEDSHDALESLLTLLPARQQLMRDGVKNSMRAFDARYNILKHDVTESSRTAFFGRALDPTYIACQQDAGKGSRDRNYARICNAMTNVHLYEQILERFDTELSRHTAMLQQELRDELTQHVAALRQSLDLLRAENAVEESERDPEFRLRVQEALDGAKERLERVNGEVGEVLV